jgi:hypothetical protein
LARRALLIVAVMLLAVPPASAADPILPLAELRPGTSCTGLSVIRGTAVSSFDVEIVDVIAGEAGLSGPRILVRVSGPAVDPTGVGPGFSGSPILCGGRNAGAISEAIGEYGNHVVLATPIEEMLREQPRAPLSARRDPALLRAARPLAAPLTVSGLTGPSLRLFERAARRAGHPLLAAPAGPLGGFGPAPLVPGAAVSASISTGDLAVGAVGTVSYRDGDRLWAFGHQLDGLGRRSLFLTDAYVFSVINNPLGLAEVGATTYKLASPSGTVQGAITSDGFAAITGTVGAPPAAIPLRIAARSGDGRVALESQLADERALGLGAGIAFVAPLGVSQAVDRMLGERAPTRVSLCARFHVRELPRPIGYCNPYFGIEAALLDLTTAAGLVDSYDLSPLHIERVRVNVRARPGVESDVLVSARGPRRVRRDQRIRVRVGLQRRHDGRRSLSVPVRVPRDLRPGARTLVLTGNGGLPSLEDELVLELFNVVFEEFGGGGGADSEPHSLRELAARVGDLRRPLGITARIKGHEPQVVHRSDEISFEGRVAVRLRVAGRRPR